MHTLVSFNCRPVEVGEPTIHAIGSGSLFGKGVFTTIAVYNWQPFCWDSHWRRLEDNASRIGLDLSAFTDHTEAVTAQALEELLGDNKAPTCRARITFFDESASELWPYHSGRSTSLLITTSDFTPPSRDLRITVSPHQVNSTSPLAGVKSCNYLEKIMAKDEAGSRGFDEAIQLNERGEIASACMANVFWLKSERVFTPSLKTGCLAGTTREFVIEKIKCEEVEAGIAELREADQIFLTSAGLGIAPVTELDARRLELAPHAITTLLPTPA